VTDSTPYYTRNGALRVPGHTLESEGDPFSPNGGRYVLQSGLGCAKCSCGWLSVPLGSNRKRRDVHAAHKREVAAAMGYEVRA